MELKPGTPEYQEAYDKEMQRLEAEAKPETKPEAKTTSEEKPERAPEKLEAVDTTAELAKVQKALKDTQRWGHENAARVKRLEKEAEDRKRQETRPAILEANPGLEDAIKHVAGDRAAETDSRQQWLSTVSTAVPDVEELLGDKDFHAKATAKKSELGSEWDNPLIAIRELSSLKAEHQSLKASQAAVESARKDFEEKSKKRNAMSVPGGSGGKGDTSSNDDAVKRYATMSTAEFAKERSRVMGY